MRVLLDTDVVLDVLTDRQPFSQAAAALWQASEVGRVEAYISALTPTNVFYVVRRLRDAGIARQAVEELLSVFRVCPVDGAILHAARALPFADYEDAVQHASASASGMEAIVTRNITDYRAATLPIYLPTDFLQLLPPASTTGA